MAKVLGKPAGGKEIKGMADRSRHCRRPAATGMLGSMSIDFPDVGFGMGPRVGTSR
jgi:hypothetical protein